MATDTRVTAKFNGKSILVTEGTVHAMDALAKSLGYKDHTVFDCYQGGWQGSTSYSGNTHGKEALDLSAARGAEKVKNGRLLGIWLDQRLPTEGPWVKHIHGARLSPGASFLHSSMTGQQNQYLAGRNGLINGKKDDDYRPRYPNIRFVDDRLHERWIALKATKGYSQPGGHSSDVKTSRAKGWTWAADNIATVRVNGVEWLVTESMTFYRKSDFAVYKPGFVARKQKFIVIAAPAYGRAAPDLKAKKVTSGRAKGYIMSSVGYVDVDGVRWERTSAGSYYHGPSFKAYTAPPTTPKPTTPAPKPVAQSVNRKVATLNVIVNRLNPTNPPRISDWKKGSSWATRAPKCAAMVQGSHVVVSEETGTKANAATFNKALGSKWQDTVWGDGWDISQGVHFDSGVSTKSKTQAVVMTPAGPGRSHNIANLTRLVDVETGIPYWICALHLIAGSANDKQRGQQIKSLVPQVLKITGKEPVLYIGDMNGAIGVGSDEVGKAFKSFGIVDAENTDCAVVNPKVNSYNGLKAEPTLKSVQIDRAFAKPGDIKFRKREVVAALKDGKFSPLPKDYSDHQPVEFEITIYRK